jgi:hypothetical protein
MNHVDAAAESDASWIGRYDFCEKAAELCAVQKRIIGPLQKTVRLRKQIRG